MCVHIDCSIMALRVLRVGVCHYVLLRECGMLRKYPLSWQKSKQGWSWGFDPGNKLLQDYAGGGLAS